MADDQTERLSQLKGGWNRIARDLDRAYSLARLTPAQWFLLSHIREQSWRYSPSDRDRKPKRVRPNLTFLARKSGFNRSGLSVQLGILIHRRFLIGTAAEGVEPQKDYAHWADCSGRQLLTETQIAWCLEIKRRDLTVERAQHAGAVNSTVGVERAQRAGAVNSTPLLSALNSGVERAQQSHIEDSRGKRPQEKREIPTPSGECVRGPHRPTTTDGLSSQPGRDPSELALIDEACRILNGHLATEPISMRLGHEHAAPDLLPLEGWRFVLAANRQVSSRVTGGKKGSWDYFVKIARSATPEDRDEAGSSTGSAPSQADLRRQQIRSDLLAHPIPLPKGIRDEGR